MKRLLRALVLLFVLMVLWLILLSTAPGFYTGSNQLNILRNVSMQGVIAFGMTMVIIAGEIDLSVGSTAAFAGCLTAWFVRFLVGPGISMPIGSAVVLSIVAAVAVGAATGSLSGVLRVSFGVPTFISTLAWLTALRGAAGLITNGFPLMPFPEWFSFLGAGYLWIIPFPAIVFLAVFLLIQFVMSYTSFGRSIYAVGGNAEAARLSGINVGLVKIAVMAIVSALAALGGIMLSSQIMAGNNTAAQGWELDIIAAVIIGGTSLMGGAGKVWATLIGVIFLGVLANGMTLLNISEFWQLVVRGVLVLVAVLINVAPTGRK